MRPNDTVRFIKNWEQLEKAYIQIDSPRFVDALNNLGLSKDDVKKKSKILNQDNSNRAELFLKR